MSSLQDVADLAGVSQATASRVLTSSSHPVAPATRTRVLEAAHTLDFEPNLLARGLAKQRTHTVGVIVHDVMDEYFSEIARGVEDVAYANGYAAFVCNSDRLPDKEVLYLRKLRSMRVDAIIFTAGGIHDADHQRKVRRQLDQIEAAGGVTVRLAPHPSERPDIAYSNTMGFRLAVDHLWDLGHRRIAFLAGPSRLATSRERLTAVRRALKRHDVVLSEDLVFDAEFSRDGGELAADKFIAAGCPATAVIAANDQSAIGVVRRLRAGGVDVPRDVSVVGFDDIAPCAYVEPALTTVHAPLYDLGAEGMRLVLRLLAGELRPPPRNMPLELIVRASTAPPEQGSRP